MMNTRRRTDDAGGRGLEIGLLAVAGVITVVAAGSMLVGDGGVAGGDGTSTEVLPAARVTELVDARLADVRLAPHRVETLHQEAAGAGLSDEAEVDTFVDDRLAQWNLKPDGMLIVNDCDPDASACVDVENLQAWLQEGGSIIYGPVPVAVGGPGTPTHEGRYTVTGKEIDDLNPVFGLPPRPFIVWLSDAGLSLRQGPLGTPSDGAVQLDTLDAPTFFDRLEVGEVVHLF